MATKTQKSFHLHSFKNRRLYPISKYPLTHLLDRLNIDHHISKQSSYVEHFIYAFILLLCCILIGTIFFRLHIQVYNTVFGPFHFNQEQFIDYVNKYKHKNEQTFFSRFQIPIEYIQVELNENNIQNPKSKYDIIRRYSDPRTRRHHIATYKRLQRPSIYIKLPTQSQKYFHTQHPIRFHFYSIRTLQCIIKNLPLTSPDMYRTWVEKSDYIQFINQEYTKNSTEFNKAVLTKCGILIGYLYRPLYEAAFTPTSEHIFTKFDIALNMTEAYYSFYSFIICGLIFVWLLIKSLIYLILYLSNQIRYKILHQYGIFSFSLKLFPDIIEELWLLNINNFPHQQLLKLDKLIQESKYKFTKNLLIIQNDSNQLFVIILKINLNQRLNISDQSSPFIVCPVTDIKKITQYGGICYGKDSSWIRWPTNEENYAEWLHEQLMEISPVYKKRFEERIRNERDDEVPSYFTGQSSNNRKKGHQRKLIRLNSTIEASGQLSDLIREENNIQRLKIERQNILENIENLRDPVSPASAQFIAKFRLEHGRNKKLVDKNMIKEQNECTLCREDLELNDFYAIWPCSGAHVFHYDCMLKSLRMRNTCPNCRHAVEGVSPMSTQAVMGRFFSRLFT